MDLALCVRVPRLVIFGKIRVGQSQRDVNSGSDTRSRNALAQGRTWPCECELDQCIHCMLFLSQVRQDITHSVRYWLPEAKDLPTPQSSVPLPSLLQVNHNNATRDSFAIWLPVLFQGLKMMSS